MRWFASCFGFLYRRWRGDVVQEYPLQAEEAASFEEAAEIEEEVDEDIESKRKQRWKWQTSL